MEKNLASTSPEASTDERAFPSIPDPVPADGFPERSRRVEGLSRPGRPASSSPSPTLAEPCPGEAEGAEPRSRRCRHDGWTPERQVSFLEALAACGVVTDACRQAGLSTQSAYVFRNRRAGRAFGTAWDAILVHRARGRLSDELLSRAMNGCIESVRENGEVTGERHRFDNRLSMAVLTRLDRLAEKQGEKEGLLRAVSEDLDDFLDCVEQGEDAYAFIAARVPPPEDAADEEPEVPDRFENSVWLEDDGRRWTAFPPPPGFEGEETGPYDGVNFYARSLSPAEEAAIERELEELRADDARDRDNYFGFSPGNCPGTPPARAPRPSHRCAATADAWPPAAGSKQPSTSSTYPSRAGEGDG